MLTLQLKEGDYVMIGDEIKICFFQDLSAKKIKLGIDAPKSVNIARNKLYEKSLEEQGEEVAWKLEEIELQKKISEMALEKSKAKERERKKRSREKKKLEQEEVTDI